jgi:hypothetical protein
VEILEKITEASEKTYDEDKILPQLTLDCFADGSGLLWR